MLYEKVKKNIKSVMCFQNKLIRWYNDIEYSSFIGTVLEEKTEYMIVESNEMKNKEDYQIKLK